jgi:hypothetical protein
MIRPASATAFAAVLLVSRMASAQGFIDVNAIRAQSADREEKTYTYVFPLYQEVAGEGVAYPQLPAAAGIDVTGGWVSRIGLGFRIGVDYVKYEQQVGLALSIPSPYYFNLDGEDTAVTDEELVRTDIGIDFGAVYTIPLPTPRVWLKVFGGPTYFRVKREMVSDLRFSQNASSLVPVNSVTITGWDTEDVNESALGYHVGVDVGFFFSEHVGVGAVLRMNRGTVDVLEPLSEEEEELKIGHTVFGAGLRLRF